MVILVIPPNHGSDNKKGSWYCYHDPRILANENSLLRVFDDDEVRHHVDHAADCWRIVVDGDVVRAAESERLDRALLLLECVADADLLTDDDLLSFCHVSISYS